MPAPSTLAKWWKWGKGHSCSLSDQYVLWIHLHWKDIKCVSPEKNIPLHSQMLLLVLMSLRKMHLSKASFSYGDSPRQLFNSGETADTECHVSVLPQIFKIKQDWGGEE